MRAETDLKAGGEDCLACGGQDGAGVGHVRPGEDHAPAVSICGDRGFNPGSCLDGNIAVAAGGNGGRCGGECGRAVGAGRHVETGEEELRVRIVEQAALDDVGVERQRGERESVDVHLAGAAEDDPVRIDHINLPLGLDAAEDLAGISRRIADLVEHDPPRGVDTRHGLIEIDGCFLADVECLPLEQGLLGGLADPNVDEAIGI